MLERKPANKAKQSCFSVLGLPIWFNSVNTHRAFTVGIEILSTVLALFSPYLSADNTVQSQHFFMQSSDVLLNLSQHSVAGSHCQWIGIAV